MKTEKQIRNRIKQMDRQRKKSLKQFKEFPYKNSKKFEHRHDLVKIQCKMTSLFEQRWALKWVLEHKK